jgi:hypothetical protein
MKEERKGRGRGRERARKKERERDECIEAGLKCKVKWAITISRFKI